jgi:hypothetical protein
MAPRWSTRLLSVANAFSEAMSKMRVNQYFQFHQIE